MKSQKSTPQSIKEAKLQYKLRHKHIVRTYDIFIAPDRQKRESLYIVMELATGERNVC
jgi:serine/threonine protein kinase